MSWLFPAALAAGAVGAALTVLAHFFARTTPEPMTFPTARFIPSTIASATRAARRPTDLLLLALRVAAIMLAAAAFAGPVLETRGSGTARVVLVDSTAAVADPAEALDSLGALGASQFPDLVIPVDSAGLSAALVKARRAVAGLAADADSAELVIISAFDSLLLDAATLEVRKQWTGRARLVEVRRADPAVAELRLASDDLAPEDPLRATLALGGWTPRRPEAAGRAVRIERGEAEGPRTGGDAIDVVHWPLTTPANEAAARARAMVIGDLVVPMLADEGDPGSGHPIARWETGAPAATLTRADDQCTVTVGARPIMAGDLPLREDFQELTAALLGACLPKGPVTPIDSATKAVLGGGGALMGLAALRRADAASDRLSAWLLVAAVAALLLELPVRRRRGT